MQRNLQTQQNQLPALRTKPKALEVMAARLSVEPGKMLAALKSTVFKGATDEEMLALVVVANEYGLNPFLREIHAFPKKGGGIVPVVGIDGWVKMVNRQQEFDGVEFDMVENEDGTPYSCTCRLYIKGRTKPVAVTEYFAECYRDTEPWRHMPRRMLRHKALIQCARVAFGFAGVYDEDEAIDVAAAVVEPPTPKFAQRPPASAPAPSPTSDPPEDNLPDDSGEWRLLRDYCDGKGFTFEHWKKFAESENLFGAFECNPQDIMGWDAIPDQMARMCLDHGAEMIAKLAAIKADEKKGRRSQPETLV